MEGHATRSTLVESIREDRHSKPDHVVGLPQGLLFTCRELGGHLDNCLTSLFVFARLLEKHLKGEKE